MDEKEKQIDEIGDSLKNRNGILKKKREKQKALLDSVLEMNQSLSIEESDLKKVSSVRVSHNKSEYSTKVDFPHNRLSPLTSSHAAPTISLTTENKR